MTISTVPGMLSRRSMVTGMAAGLLPAVPVLAAGSDDGGPLSELRILYGGRKVLVIRWSAAGAFKVVVFDRGAWEGAI